MHARVYVGEEDVGEEQCRPDRFRAWINDPQSLYNAFLALIQCVTARETEGGSLELPRLSHFEETKT